MRHLALSLLLLAGSISACGQNEAQPDEVNTPESPAAMQETEQQREQQLDQAEEKKEAAEFDAAEQ